MFPIYLLVVGMVIEGLAFWVSRSMAKEPRIAIRRYTLIFIAIASIVSGMVYYHKEARSSNKITTELRK